MRKKDTMISRSLRDQILIAVDTHYPITSVELVLRVMEMVGITKLVLNEFNTTVSDLIQKREIVEVEYVLPDMDYRVKSVYFPKGTEVKRGKIQAN